MSFFCRTPSFTNIAFVDSPDPLTWYCFLQRKLSVFVGKGGLICMQNVRLPSTHSSQGLASRVCNLMRLCPIHLSPPGYGARTSPILYPANRFLSDGRPQCIPCYKRCSKDSFLWCWDETTHASAGDPLPHHRG